MSKYEGLWAYVDYLFRERNCARATLTFSQVKEITGFDIDHSFLQYKKELIEYGYRVEKISLKEEKILFGKLEGEI